MPVVRERIQLVWLIGVVIIVGGALALPVAFGGSSPAAIPPPSSPERLQHGRALYAKHCASCHGVAGAGDGAAGHDLEPRPTDLRDPEVAGKSDMKLFRQITRGRAPMPSFGRLLNDDDRWTIVAYVKTLAKGSGK